MSLIDKRINDAVQLLRNVFVDSVEVAVHLAPIVLLKYMSVLRLQQNAKIEMPTNGIEKLTLAFPDTADIFSYKIDSNFSDIGKSLNSSLRDFELSNPREMGSIFVGIDYCHPRFGSFDDRESLLRDVVSLVDKADPLVLRNTALFGGSLSELFFSSTSSGSRYFIEFATPLDVAELLASIANPKSNDRLYDATCGSGQILLACLKVAAQNGQDGLKVVGAERNYLTWLLARLNFIFCGYDPCTLRLQDSIFDSIIDPQSSEELFDVIVSNPPKFQKDWSSESAINYFERLGFGVPPKSNGDFAFLLHMVSRLKPSVGRMTVIVPDGTLFRQGAEGDIRKNLIKDQLIEAVVSLPLRTLYNTALGTSIVVINASKSHDEILLIDARSLGTPGKSRTFLNSEAIDQITTTINSRNSIKSFSRCTSIEEIANNDFSLVPNRYIESDARLVRRDLSEIAAERSDLQRQYEAIDERLNGLISEVIRIREL